MQKKSKEIVTSYEVINSKNKIIGYAAIIYYHIKIY